MRATNRFRTPVVLAVVALACMALTSCKIPPNPNTFDDKISPMPDVAAVKPAVPPAGPLELTATQAILLGLENNKSLAVERFNPSITRTGEEQQLGVFDPMLSAALQAGRQRAPGVTGGNVTTDTGQASVDVRKLFPTGTTVDAGAASARTGDQYTTRPFVTVTQALLQGAGPAVNLASLRQVRLSTLSSQYELRGFAESVLSDIETAYWNCVLAKQSIDIVQSSRDLAEKQLDETQQRIRVGVLAQTELAAAEAEVALRREALIAAQGAFDQAHLQLLRLINPPGGDLWRRQIVLKSLPVVQPNAIDDVDSHVAVALRMRPDLNQARIAIQSDDLEIVKTKNGLLPKLNLFVALGNTGYAHSFGASAADLSDGRYDASAGLSLEYPLGNHTANAAWQRSVFTRDQARESLSNMVQLANVDVRSAHISAKTALEQVSATTATRKAQEEKLRAETEKFRVGKSTSLLVATAQRDLQSSQLDEVTAVAAYLKSLVSLYRLDGSLLERRGIAAPGREAVGGL